MLSSNQIAEFYDHQYLWKEAINVLESFSVEIVTIER